MSTAKTKPYCMAPHGSLPEKLAVIYRSISELKPDPANPRLHSKKQIRQIAKSIEAFGFNVPILVDADLNVIAGHGRLLAGAELGMSEVPTLRLDHLTSAQARAFMIADNRLSEIAIWDDRLLAEQLKDLSLLGLDFDLELTGFEMGEIDLRIASLEDPVGRKDDPADLLPHLPNSPPVSQIGDVWRLGRHRVICVDWRHVEELLAAGRAAYAELKNLCVWVKDNAGMGSLYRSQHELVFVFKQGHDGHRNNVQLGQFGRNRANVWHYPGANSFARCGEEGNLLALHPTVKPVALVADAILDCSARGDIVLDGFLGSGTTVIAAERTGRRCYGLELDAAYVDSIVRGWQVLSVDSASQVGSGRCLTSLPAKWRPQMPPEAPRDYEVG